MSLEVRHISQGVEATVDYINALRSGKIKSLKTSFKKLNKALLNGVDWNRIFTIAGQSGSGKSTIVEQIKRDFIDLNPDEEFEILSFEFEMLVEDQLTRYASAKTKKTLKQIYSAEGPLDEEAYQNVMEALETKKHQPVFYVDNPGTPTQIRSTILNFAASRNLKEQNKGLVVSIDHILLTMGKQGDSEKAVVDELMFTLLEVKKYFASIGQRAIFLVLSQLNRDIEKDERVKNPMVHYPSRNDIFGASSVYHTSDYVLISHRPSTVVGMGEFYGRPRAAQGFPKGLPVRYPNDPDRDMVYWHLIKERFGKPVVIPLAEDFKNSSIEEIDLIK